MGRTLFTALFLLLGSQAHAHPLTDVRYDRTIAVRLSHEAIEVNFKLEVSPLGLHLDASRRFTPAEISQLDRTAIGYARAYSRKVAAELIDKVKLTVNGVAVPLEVTGIDVDMTDHAVCRFTLRASWPPGGRERNLTVVDETFPNKPGVLNLTIDRKGGSGNLVELLDSDEPPVKIRTRNFSQLTPEEASIARKASAEVRLPFALAPTPQAAAATSPSSPSGPTISAAAIPEPVVNAATPPPPDLASDLINRGLPALFDSTLGLGVLLLAAFLFGAGHAFTPGHGKTLVAAYLIGERGTIRHAILLAIATTLTHTGSVIAVAAILWCAYGNEVPSRTQGALQLLGGILVVAVGVWLLVRRVTGQADHFHLFGGHHHHGHSHSHSHSHGDGHSHPHTHSHAHGDGHSHPHTHSHGDGHSHSHSHAHGEGHSHPHTHSDAPDHHHAPAPESAKSTAGWFRVVLMGMGGGIVPCWDAVLLLVAATAMNRLGFAVPLLLAFSAGLGTVLVGLGIGVVYAYRAGASRFQEHRWFKFLPMVSAVFLIVVGIWLCKNSIRMVS